MYVCGKFSCAGDANGGQEPRTKKIRSEALRWLGISPLQCGFLFLLLGLFRSLFLAG